jgi:hypothetical protein
MIKALPGSCPQIRGQDPWTVRRRIAWEVLKLCVVQGVQACNLGIPIFAQELGDFEKRH